MSKLADPRAYSLDDLQHPAPRYVVWELTMRCDHACGHCGSRAVVPRSDELEDVELIAVADQLVALGSREVTLIGGEAYLHPQVCAVIGRLKAGGVRVTLQSGGRGLIPHLDAMVAAGLDSVGISIDGPQVVHDTLRGSVGSHRAAMKALRAVREAGLPMAVNTQVNRLSAPHLSEIGAMLEAEGVLRWRLQLTVPMGRAADRPEWILEPWRMIEVLDTLAEIQREVAERGRAAGVPAAQLMSVRVSNNLGYYGPHEAALRSLPGRTQQFWAGCHAGQQVMGIESNGRIKGCPSLPTAPYVGGNIRDLSIGEIWEKTPELRFTRDRDSGELWGFCESCYYAETCMAGCSFTAHCTMGRRGNNPFCYHRAATLKKQGKRERLVQVETAAGRPYDYGRFEIVQEAWVDGE